MGVFRNVVLRVSVTSYIPLPNYKSYVIKIIDRVVSLRLLKEFVTYWVTKSYHNPPSVKEYSTLRQDFLL